MMTVSSRHAAGRKANGVDPIDKPVSAEAGIDDLRHAVFDAKLTLLLGNLTSLTKTVRFVAILTALSVGTNLLELGLRVWQGINFSW
ncbi:MAG TPA: hypothetical protein VL985_05215 [Stellaceae bacterium]|nr:hypothetical protein [Stellaceae bacterium]